MLHTPQREQPKGQAIITIEQAYCEAVSQLNSMKSCEPKFGTKHARGDHQGRQPIEDQVPRDPRNSGGTGKRCGLIVDFRILTKQPYTIVNVVG